MSLMQYEISIPYVPRVKNKCTLNLGERFKKMQAGDPLSLVSMGRQCAM